MLLVLLVSKTQYKSDKQNLEKILKILVRRYLTLLGWSKDWLQLKNFINWK